MNKYLTILLVAIISFQSFGQDACSKFEQSQKLKSNIGNEGLKYVKTYWAKRCACESGATATGSFDSAVKIANINYAHYQKNKEWYKTHFNGSSSLLPNKRMTVSDCKKENKSQINSINYGDCQSQTIGTDKDPQRFISDYMTAKCMCEKGVASKTESDQLFIQMQVAYDGYKMHYVNPSVVLQNPKDIEPCPIVKIGENNAPIKDDKWGSLVQLEGWKADFVQQNDPRGYSNYKSAEGISNQGKVLVNSLASNLANYKTLISTTDPDELLKDFNQKMQNIELLEDKYLQDSRSFGYQQGQSIGNKLNSGDYEGAVYNFAGFISANREMKQAQQKIAAQKQALQEQKKAFQEKKRTQNSQIYWKAVKLNNNTIDKYYQMAAYAENIQDEKYYLAFIDYLNCYSASMEKNWSSSHTAWLTNNCPKPKKLAPLIENKFIAKDVQYNNIAKRKFGTYLKVKPKSNTLGINLHYQDAAILFMAAAASLNPKASYFYKMGRYETQPILALNYMLVAKNLDANFFDNEKESELEKIMLEAKYVITGAITRNDIAYINSFLDAGLDKIIRFDNRSLLSFVISIDQPDVMQQIMNKYVEIKNTDETNEIVQKCILLAAAANSEKCIQRFIDLEVPMDFTVKSYSPIDVANKAISTEVFLLLLNNSVKKSFYKVKFKNSNTYMLATIGTLPVRSASIKNEYKQQLNNQVITKMVDDLLKTPNYITTLGQALNAKEIIQSNPTLKNKVLNAFLENLKMYLPESEAHLFLQYGLVSFDHVPSLLEIQREHNPNIKPFDFLDEIKLAIQHFDDEGYGNMVLLYEKFLDNPSIMTTDEINSLHSMVFTFVHLNNNNEYLHLQYRYKEYLLSKTQGIPNVSLEEKIKFLIQEGKDKGLPTNSVVDALNNIEDTKQNSELIKVYNHSYATSSVQQGIPLDANTVELLFDVDDNIAFFALTNYNPLLFKAIDDKFDLSKVENRDGLSLFEYMLTSNSFYPLEENSINTNLIDYSESQEVKSELLKYKHLYLSKDFDFKTQINGKYPLVIYTEHIETRDTKELKKIIDYYKIDINMPITANEGTLLHYFTQKLINDGAPASDRYSNYFEHLWFVTSLNLNKNAKNNEGKTAWDIFIDNESSLKEKWLKVYPKSTWKIIKSKYEEYLR